MTEPKLIRTHVRFSLSESARILKDQALIGKSVPWLLKTHYFKKEISAPTLDSETRFQVRKELAQIGNQLLEINKKISAELHPGLAVELQESLQTLRVLKSYLGKNYGDR